MMDEKKRYRVAQQGLGHLFIPTKCPNCNYVAQTNEEKEVLSSPELACPNCGIKGMPGRLVHTQYFEIANWIGEFTVEGSRKGFTSAVILFCALTESLLEKVIDDYIQLNPHLESKGSQRKFKEVFGASLQEILEKGPQQIRNFSSDWRELSRKRNKFLHGKASSFHINEHDAIQAMDLVPVALKSYVWLNNKYCIKK